jgi:hypothetical protein
MNIQSKNFNFSDNANFFKYRAFTYYDDFLNDKSRFAILNMNGTYQTHQLAIKAIKLQISHLDKKMKKDMKHAPKSLGHQSVLKIIISRIEELETIPASHL